MTDLFSEDETVAAVTLLNTARLRAFVRSDAVKPMRSEVGLVYRQVDLARLELLCDLTEHFDLGEDELDIILSLIDQLHCVRGELRAIAEAIASESHDVRARIGEALQRHEQSGPADT